MTLSSKQLSDIVNVAVDNALDLSLPEIGAQFGISGERVRQILDKRNITKKRKLGQEYQCKKCPNQFRGTRAYSGHKAVMCNACRAKRGK